MATISIIFYYTEAFEAVTPDPEAVIQHLLDCTNGALLLSRIPVFLKLHCILRTDLREAPNSNDRLREFRESQGATERYQSKEHNIPNIIILHSLLRK